MSRTPRPAPEPGTAEATPSDRGEAAPEAGEHREPAEDAGIGGKRPRSFHERRADDVLAPVLFALVGAVRAASVRVAATASGASDPEAIHDLRVALRRLRTALRPGRSLYGKRRMRQANADLRGFAQAAGALRDEEVLRETLDALELSSRSRSALGAWLVQRARRERALRKRVASTIAVPVAGEALAEVLARLERRLGKRRAEERGAHALAEEAIADATAGVIDLVGAPLDDANAMHALRIRYKRLRYTAELFEPVLGDRAAPIAKSAARMQKRLGELHDLDEAILRIGRARGLSLAARNAIARALMLSRARLVERLRSDLADERRRLTHATA